MPKEQNNESDAIECYVQRGARWAPVFTLRLSLTLKLLPALTSGVTVVSEHIKDYYFHKIAKLETVSMGGSGSQQNRHFFFLVHSHSIETQHAKCH